MEELSKGPLKGGERSAETKRAGNRAFRFRFTWVEVGADQQPGGGGGAGAGHGGRRQANAGDEESEVHPRPRRYARVLATRSCPVHLPPSCFLGGGSFSSRLKNSCVACGAAACCVALRFFGGVWYGSLGWLQEPFYDSANQSRPSKWLRARSPGKYADRSCFTQTKPKNVASPSSHADGRRRVSAGRRISTTARARGVAGHTGPRGAASADPLGGGAPGEEEGTRGGEVRGGGRAEEKLVWGRAAVAPGLARGWRRAVG